MEKRKLNGLPFKKGGRKELREFLSAKYHKDDQIVSKHIEGSSVWKSWRPAAPL